MSALSAGITGVLLAAGTGLRAGGPKALRVDADGTSWLVRSSLVLLDGGCDGVVVVLGSGAAAARRLLDEASSWAGPAAALPSGFPAERLTVVQVSGGGMGISLRAGLAAVTSALGGGVLVSLVDLPDVGAAVVRRVLASSPLDGGVLARASYRGRPGHPVLIGADHLPRLAAELTGDTGARDYLSRHSPVLVECGDLASGEDRDLPG